MNVTVSAASGEANGPLITLNNIGSVNFRTLAAAPINAQLFTNVGTVGSSGSTNVLTVNNGALASTYSLSNTVATNQDGLAIGIRGGDVAGTTSTINFSVASVGTGNTAALGTPSNLVRSLLSTTTTGIENISIATSGTNRMQFTGNTTATTDSVLLTITGSGTNDISVANGGLATTSTITAATATGTLTLNVNAGLTTGDTIVGGTGTTDTLQASISNSVATGLAVSAIETLRISAGANGGTLGFTTNPGFTTVRIDAVAAAGNAGAVANQLLSGGGFTTLNLVGNSTTASATAANNFNGISATGGYTGTADTLTVNIGNGGVTLAAGGGFGVGHAITTTGVESYVVRVTDTTANTNTTALSNISDSAMTSLTATTDGNITFGTVGNIAGTAGVTGNLTTINMTGVTGTNAATTMTIANNSLAAAAAITAGAGGLTVTTNAEQATDVITFTGGIGADTLAAGAFLGSVVFVGGTGADSVTLGGTGAVSTSLTATGGTATSGTGVDLFSATNVTTVAITDFGTGDGLNLIADLGTVNSTAATITVESSFTAVASAANALATNVVFLRDGGAGAGTLTATFNLSTAATTFNIGLAENGGAGTLNGARINASSSASTITGTNAADTITGGAGNDSIFNQSAFGVAASVASAADVLTGGAGSDTFALYGSQAVGGGSAIATALGASSRIADFTVAGGLGVADVLALSDTVANYQTFVAAPNNIQGAAAVAGTTSIQTVAQNAAAAALVAGTNLVKLTTAISPAGTVQQAFDAAIGTGTVTGFAATTAVFVSLYDAVNQRAEILLANVRTGADATTLETADIVQLVGSINMSAADYAAFGVNNLAIIA